jgi:hypothetical protein
LADIERSRSQARLGKASGQHVLLSIYNHRACKDPRDRIYALLPLVDEYKDVVPDYELSAGKLFANVTLILLGLTGLECLCIAAYGPKYNGLSSWPVILIYQIKKFLVTI